MDTKSEPVHDGDAGLIRHGKTLCCQTNPWQPQSRTQSKALSNTEQTTSRLLHPNARTLTYLGQFDDALDEGLKADAVLASSDSYEFGALKCAMAELCWACGEHDKYREVMADAKLRIGRFQLPDTAPLMIALNRAEQVAQV